MRWAPNELQCNKLPAVVAHAVSICAGAGFWVPGGGVDPGERLTEAAVRECWEEAGGTDVGLRSRANNFVKMPSLCFASTKSIPRCGSVLRTDASDKVICASHRAVWCGVVLGVGVPLLQVEQYPCRREVYLVCPGPCSLLVACIVALAYTPAHWASPVHWLTQLPQGQPPWRFRF
jgi:hypothetical protein